MLLARARGWAWQGGCEPTAGLESSVLLLPLPCHKFLHLPRFLLVLQEFFITPKVWAGLSGYLYIECLKAIISCV